MLWSLLMPPYDDGPFENEDAQLFFTEARAQDPADVPELLRESLLTAADSDGYLDAADAHRGIAAALIVAAGVSDPGDAGIEDDAVAEWLGAVDFDIPDDLPIVALRALDRISGPDSEWAELWAESGELDEARQALSPARTVLADAAA
jgi:Domain of unknown function (DUF4259)